jgi:hypothetical protein
MQSTEGLGKELWKSNTQHQKAFYLQEYGVLGSTIFAFGMERNYIVESLLPEVLRSTYPSTPNK